MGSAKAWLSAMRLRTLPLAVACIAMGSFLAAFNNVFNLKIFIAALITAIALQILSNLANDYGDSQSGVDDAGRVGPIRAIQSGAITKSQMKKAMVVNALLAFCGGVATVFFAFDNPLFIILFLIIGLLAIAAAVKYTVGKNPYGYMGLGDIFVFLFFGIVGVCGTYFLFAGKLYLTTLLPATAFGALSVGVLNLNNLRDWENDKTHGKNTLVVKLGSPFGKIYQTLLIALAFTSIIAFVIISYQSIWQWLFLITLPLFIIQLFKIHKNKIPKDLDPELKKLAIFTVLFTLSFGAGLLLK